MIGSFLWYLRTRPYELGSLLTRLLNIALGGRASETTSARAYRLAEAGRPFWRTFRRIINILLRPFEKQHCARTWRVRVERARQTLAVDAEIQNTTDERRT